jgi:hypothetical protein
MHRAYKARPDRYFAFPATPRTVPAMRMTALIALAVAAALGACAGEDEQPPEAPAPAPSRERPVSPAVPDGGVPEGHGAEDEAPPPRERGSIVVPERDPTPPRPVVRLNTARATLDIGPIPSCQISGEAWTDTTNASGLDATSKHIHFSSR